MSTYVDAEGILEKIDIVKLNDEIDRLWHGSGFCGIRFQNHCGD